MSSTRSDPFPDSVLGRSEGWLRSLLENMSDAAVLVDEGGVFHYATPSMEDISGIPPSELIGEPMWQFVHPEDVSYLKRRLASRVAGEGDPERYTEIRFRHREDGWRTLQLRGSRYESPSGALGVVAVVRDVTRERRLQEQLYWSQRLEAVGRLAGGVAHHFNNLLTVIQGNASMLLEDDRTEDDRTEADPAGGDAAESRTEPLEEIRRAAEDANGLARKLLAFSRMQEAEPRSLDLNRSVRDVRSLLERVVGEDVVIRTRLVAEPLPVIMDPLQLEHVLTELVVNAREAMPEGGTITITTAAEDSGGGEDGAAADDAAGAEDTAAGEGTPGAATHRAILTVEDTGRGMSEGTMRRIFDPFFTTASRELSDGSGLGLSTVYGLVKRAGGSIGVESEIGRGSAFRVSLPMA